jgi:uncharacterized protein
MHASKYIGGAGDRQTADAVCASPDLWPSAIGSLILPPTLGERMRLAFLTIVCLTAASSAEAASFDCAKAVAVEEHAVCADPRLSALDSTLGQAFAEAKKFAASDRQDMARLMAVARIFLAQRHACGARQSCLIASYAGALEGYRNVGSTIAIPAWIDAPGIADGDAPPSSSLPTRPGQCVATQVAEVGPRLSDGGPIKPEDFDSGTAISFTNGGVQVSYEREPALIESRRGDNVVMCLLAIPQLCPPGDARGRSYIVTNMRTRRTWTLGDSQHMCGGA